MAQKLINHPTQRHIVSILSRQPDARFSELITEKLESNMITYHLRQLEREGLIESPDKGLYKLTELGKQLGGRIEARPDTLLRRAHCVLILAVQRKGDGAWLMRRRLTQPLLGKSGFMHTEPVPFERQEDTASSSLQALTGLHGTFRYICSGLQTSSHDESMENFISLNLLYCTDASGDLQVNDPHGEYCWLQSPDWADPAMVPSMPVLAEQLHSPRPEFLHLFFDV